MLLVFVTGESCFSAYISSNTKLKVGSKVDLVFSIHLHQRDIKLLEKIRIFFKSAGNIQINADGSITYAVTSVKDLSDYIIPHFEKYPLLTQKQADFELFKQIVELMKSKEHLNVEGIQKLVNIRASMNKGLSKRLAIAFPNIIPEAKPEFKLVQNSNLSNTNYWLAGFVTGEGCFFC